MKPTYPSASLVAMLVTSLAPAALLALLASPSPQGVVTTAWLADVDGGQLFRTTKDDPAGSLTPFAPLPVGTTAVDLDLVGGELWLVRDSVGPLPEAGTVDLATGEYTTRGLNLPFTRADALATSPAGGPWYVVENVGADALVWRGSLLHARMEVVATLTGAAPVTAIAVDLDGNVFAFDDGRNEIIAVDPVAGTGSVLSTASLAGRFVDWDFDWATGELVGAYHRGATWLGLVGIDPPTGVVTVLDDLSGLGFEPRIAIQRSGREIDVQRYCAPASVGSSGVPASLHARGSVLRDLADITLVARSTATDTFGLFLASMEHAPAITPPGALGQLCLGSPIGRIQSAGGLLATGPGGTFSVTLNLDAIPQPIGAVAADAWSSWTFQGWFRDSDQGTATSNFTDAIRVPVVERTSTAAYHHPAFVADFSTAAFADMTGDGVDELVVVSATSNPGEVQVRGLDAHGQFSEILSIQRSNWRADFSLGDLDGDGDVDVAIATRSQRLVTLVNDGSGGLSENTRLQVCETDMENVTIADFNGDGIIDTACGCDAGNFTEISYGTGGGAFLPAVGAQADGSLLDGKIFGAGDANGDGVVDIFCDGPSGQPASMQVVLGLGSGVFGAPTVYGRPDLGTLGTSRAIDVTGEGRTDVIVQSSLDFEVTSFIADPSGSFGTGSATALSRELFVGGHSDVDGDGDIDLLGVSRQTAEVDGRVLELLRSNGDGTFDRSTVAVGISERWTIARSDLAISGRTSGDSLVVALRADFNSAEVIRPFQAPLRTAVTTPIQGTNSSGTFSLGIRLADFDGDGMQDALVTVPAPNGNRQLTLRRGQGDGTFPGSTLLEPRDVRNFVVVDIDSDGDSDAIGRNGSMVSVYRNVGGALSVETVATSGDQFGAVTHGDLDGDGWMDLMIVVADGLTLPRLEIFRQDTGGTFAPVETGPEIPYANDMVTGDFDGDGLLDLAIVHWHQSRVHYGVEEGGITAFDMTPRMLGFQALRVETGDISGDGVPDLVAAYTNSDELFFATALPDRSFAVQGLELDDGWPTDVGLRDIDLGDTNGDGRPDVLASTTEGIAFLVTNLGHGSFGQVDPLPGLPYVLPTNGGVTFDRLRLGDADNDGILDLLRYSPTEDRIEVRTRRLP